MSKRSYKGLILNTILVIFVFNVGVLGYRLTQAPIDLVEIKVDKKVIGPQEDLHLIINNYGFRSVSYWGCEPIYRIYNNDTIKRIKYPDNVAWAAISYSVYPLIDTARWNIYTDHLEPGNYLIKKDFKIHGYGEYYKIVSFSVR